VRVNLYGSYAVHFEVQVLSLDSTWSDVVRYSPIR